MEPKSRQDLENLIAPIKKCAIEMAKQELLDSSVKKITRSEQLQKITENMGKLEVRKKLKRKEPLLETLFDLGKSLIFVDNNEAIDYFKDAFELATELNLVNAEGEAILYLSKISTLQGDFANSIRYLHQYMDLRSHLKTPAESSYIQKKLYQAYTIVGRFDEANLYSSSNVDPDEMQEVSSSIQPLSTISSALLPDQFVNMSKLSSKDLDTETELNTFEDFNDDLDFEDMFDDIDTEIMDDVFIDDIDISSTITNYGDNEDVTDLETSNAQLLSVDQPITAISDLMIRRSETDFYVNNSAGPSFLTSPCFTQEIITTSPIRNSELLSNNIRYEYNLECFEIYKTQVRNAETDFELINGYTNLSAVCKSLQFYHLGLISAKQLKRMYEKNKDMVNLVLVKYEITEIENILTKLRKPKDTVYCAIPKLPSENDYLENIKSNYKFGKSWYQKNIEGLMYLDKNKYNSAYKVFTSNIIFARGMIGDPYAIYETMRNIGLMAARSGKYPYAISIFQKLFGYIRKNGNNYLIISVLYYLMELLYKREKQILTDQNGVDSPEFDIVRTMHFNYKKERLRMYAKERAYYDEDYDVYLEEYNKFGVHQDGIIAYHWMEIQATSIGAKSLSRSFQVILGDLYFRLGQFKVAEKYYKNAFTFKSTQGKLKFHINYKLYQIYYYFGDIIEAKRRIILMRNTVVKYPNETNFRQMYKSYVDYLFFSGQYAIAYSAASSYYDYCKLLGDDEFETNRARRNHQELKAIMEITRINVVSLPDNMRNWIII